MERITIKTHVGQNGILTVKVPQFKDAEVEVIVTAVQIIDQLAIFDIPSLQLPSQHPALHIISREEMYGDDGR
jgi:hypothetical protein